MRQPALLPTLLFALLAGPAAGQSLPGLTITGTTFSYAAPDGLVTGSLRLPSGPGPHPAMLLSHGKGGTGSNINQQHGSVFTGWGFVCIAPDYTHAGAATNPSDNEAYCPENSRRARRALEILAAVPGVEMGKLALFGHSMGGYMTAGFSGELGAQAKAVAVSAGGTSGVENTSLAAPSPSEVSNASAPTLIFHGAQDTTVPPAQSALLAGILTSEGVTCRRLLFETIGHDLPQVRTTEMHALWRGWLTEHGVLTVAGGTAPSLAAPTTLVARVAEAAVLPISIADAETAATALNLRAISLDEARLPTSSLALTGTGTARSLVVTPPAGTDTSAPVTVWLSVDDGILGRTAPVEITLLPPEPATSVNHRPTITRVADQRTTPGTVVNGLTVTLADAETPASQLTLTAVSSNPAVLPTSAITLGSGASSRTLTLAPLAGVSGTATITLTVSDGDRTTATAFTLTVAPTVAGNTAPLLQVQPDVVLPAGVGLGPVPLVVRDNEAAEASLVFTVSSSNTALLPTGSLVVGGTNWGRTLTASPAPGVTGRATVTVTVSDGTLSTSSAFVLEVVDADTPATIVPATTTVVAALGSGPQTVPIDIADTQVASTALRLAARSSNQTLLPDGALALSGTGAQRTVTLTPSAGQTGAATVTLTVTDGTFSTEANVLCVVHDPAAPASRFSRPRGLYVLDSAGPATYTTSFGTTISLRDANIRSLAFVDGFTLRAAWSDLESPTTPGHYDFGIIANALRKLPAGQKLSLIIVPAEPAYIATTPGVVTWNDAGTIRAVPWDATLRARRRALLQALSTAVLDGSALRDDPRLDVLDPYLPGGFTGIRDPNSTPLRQLPQYSREALLGAVQDELRSLQDAFPGRFVHLGFWPVVDSNNAAYGGTSLADWLRAALVAEFNGTNRPRIGFFMENLAARRDLPGAPATSTPVTSFAQPEFAGRDAVWNAFQMLGSWVRPFNDNHVTNTLHGSPADALDAAYNTYRAEYFEVYVTDIDHQPFQAGLQRWHDFLASAATTAPDSDEDGDSLPYDWETAYGLRPTLPESLDDDSLDGDGIPLLLEFAYGGSPTQADGDLAPKTGLRTDATTGEQFLTLTFHRRTDALALGMTLEETADLQSWTPVTGAVELERAPAVESGTEVVTLRLPAAPGSASQPRFVRLVVH